MGSGQCIQGTSAGGIAFFSAQLPTVKADTSEQSIPEWGSLGSGLQCVREGPLGPWSCYNFRAINWLAFEFYLSQVFFKMLS